VPFAGVLLTSRGDVEMDEHLEGGTVTVEMFTDKERILLFRRLIVPCFILLSAVSSVFILIYAAIHSKLHALIHAFMLFTVSMFIGLLCGYLIRSHFNCKKVEMRPMEIEIINGLNFKRVIRVDDVGDVRIERSDDIFEKNWDVYRISIILRDGEWRNISCFVHIDTLLGFLRRFTEHYGDALTPRCRSSIQEFLDAHARERECGVGAAHEWGGG
jgi:hypothetical protein